MGYAYLPDGTRIDYEQYLRTGYWRNKRHDRLAFDNWQCAVCHKPIDGQMFHTHHLDYARLGHEDMNHDIITMCRECHNTFHEKWKKVDYWIANEQSPIDHWKDYSLQHTARLCRMYKNEDYWFGGSCNLCSFETARGFIDRYFIDTGLTDPVVISEQDISLAFRNMRYDIVFANVENKVDMDAWLDEKFGSKGQKGGNKARSDARTYYTRHKIGAMKRIYKENMNIIILMDEIKKQEEETHEQA